MKLLLQLAWRNLWRNRRRTQLTMGAMIFACAILVFSLGYYDGILWNLINNATERENGHICVAAPGYFAAPTLSDYIDAKELSNLQTIINEPIKGICPRISAFALLSCGEAEMSSTHPAQIIGIDPKTEKYCSRLAEDIKEGTFLSGEPGEIIIGKSLARKLKAKTGSEVILFSSAADGSIASEILSVQGIFDSDDTMRDSSLAFMDIKQAQTTFALEGRVHSLRIFSKDPLRAEEIAKLINLNKNLEATSWQQMFPQVADLLKIWLNVQLFTTALYYAALALITFNTMNMAFLERRREFAVLKAIGLDRLRLATVILLESLIISGLSATVGVIIGSVLNFYLYYYPLDLSRWLQTIAWGGSTMKPVLLAVPSFISVFMPFAAMLLLGIFVALLPNYRLYRLKPVEALRES